MLGYCHYSCIFLKLVQIIGSGCLFLAAKLEETPKRTGDIVSIFFDLERRHDGLGHMVLDQGSQVRA